MKSGLFAREEGTAKTDLVWPWVSTFVALCIMYGSQFIAALILKILNINILIFEGLNYTIYSVIAVVLLFLYSHFSAGFYSDRKPGAVFRRPKISVMVLVFMLALGLLGIVSLYMEYVVSLAEKTEEVAQKLEEYNDSVERYVDLEGLTVPRYDRVLYYIAVCFIVPVAEEMIFRGVILGQFLKSYKPWVGLLISTLVFGLVHGLSIHIGYALICGFVIGLVYVLTENMLMPILIHMTFNVFGSGISSFLGDGWVNITDEQSIAVRGALSVIELRLAPMVVFGIMLLFFIRRSEIHKAQGLVRETTAFDSVPRKKSDEEKQDIKITIE